MRDNPLQFGTVREDPRLEQAVLERFGPRRLLLIASGGCTALAVSGWFPEARITAIDANPAQLEHVAAKQSAMRSRAPLNAFTELAERGNFESLFRMLRGLIQDLVLPADALDELFETGSPRLVDSLLSSGYWAVAFELAFSDALVIEMFGPDAVQHAVPGSYPGYFRRALERGLRRSDVTTNYFLHHILSGRYYEHAPPDFFAVGAADQIELVCGDIAGVDFGEFDYIGLSNVMDWMSGEAVSALLARIAAESQPGTTVMWRQLNNTRPLYELLGSSFVHEHEMGRSLRAQDRSLFYGRIHVCHRT